MKILLLLPALTLILSGCGQSQSSTTMDDGAITDAHVHELVQNDLQALDDLDTAQLSLYDKNPSTLGVFTRIFNGTDAASIREYLDQRAQYFLTQTEFSQIRISPGGFENTGWESFLHSTQVEVGAANIGLLFWLDGLVNIVPVKLLYNGNILNVDNSRFGLILMGPGYRDSFTVRGKKVEYPPAYRQAILLHEARHSDCTGGITENDLIQLRHFKNSRQMDAQYRNKKCGHLHNFCPSGDYEGLQACDDLPWGAYAIQWVFLSAIAPSYSGIDRAVMDIAVIDTKSRLTFDADDMIAMRMGPPDMSSGGLH